VRPAAARVAVCALALFACSREPAWAPPPKIALSLAKIERTAENEKAALMMGLLEGQGLTDRVGAIYEFEIIPYKPIFYLGAAKGRVADTRKLLEEAVAFLEGERQQEPKEHNEAGVSFLCAPFRRGQGMVSMSAACVWKDGKTAGFGLGVAGRSVDEVFRWTVEARKLVMAPRPAAGPAPWGWPVSLLTGSRPDSERDKTVRDIVAALLAYDCGRFKGYLPEKGADLLRERIRPEILNTIKDPVEKACFVLGLAGYPRTETMRIETRSAQGDHATVAIPGGRSGTILVHLVSEGGRWKVDPDWALKEVRDYEARMALLAFAMTIESYAALRAFTDDSRELGRKTSTIATFEKGMAEPFSRPGSVYALLSPSRDAVCASSRSESEEFFMIRQDTKGASYFRGKTLPGECPSAPLSRAW
jgi:hypothetical protein